MSPSSPISSIFVFLLFLNFSGTITSQNATSDELQILLELKLSLGISNSTRGFDSWRADIPACQFSGISCNDGISVSGIDLSNRYLGGKISFLSLCKLPSLSKLYMGYTAINGNIDEEIWKCKNLEVLDLEGNSLSGVIPDLSSLKKLQMLNLSGNGFIGNFPWTSLLSKADLYSLSLGDNPFDPTVSFPKAILNMTKLRWLYLSNCGIQGQIPPEIGNLKDLENLEVADSLLFGEIPEEITNLGLLWQLELYNNSLTGTLPRGFGKLSNLVYLDASMNNLQGNLSEIRNLTKLVSLQLFQNNFTGELPPDIGDFKNLVNLSLYTNQLSGELPNSLGSWSDFNYIDVSTNFFIGNIPPSMCKKNTMKRLLMLENRFTGEIPETYGNCTSLIRFRVSNNFLSGSIPATIWSLPNLNILDLANNNFSGPIHPEIKKAKSLSQLFISDNQFSGELPAEIARVSSLVSLDASNNQISGRIPTAISDLKNLGSLNLQGNKITGEIPPTLGSCFSLAQINLAQNSLSGPIPIILTNLSNLNSLNLSSNHLSGEVPEALSWLKLSELDLSNNDLSGELPSGLAIDAYSRSFVGNPNLCSSTAHFLRSCSSKHSDRLKTLLPAIVAAFAASFIIMYLFFLKRPKKIKNTLLSKNSWDMKSFQTISFDEKKIIRAIRPENLIGSGGSGRVYRVDLGNGQTVAVKQICNSKSFNAEVSALSSIRHTNVVKLFCSITSEEHSSSLIVYEHLCNGSLWDRLHEEEVESEKLESLLDWCTRYEVAVGAARGLEYLHHGLHRPILHCDIKSSNILLDEFFVPRIADFGISKTVYSAGDGSSGQVAGTLGYIPPGMIKPILNKPYCGIDWILALISLSSGG